MKQSCIASALAAALVVVVWPGASSAEGQAGNAAAATRAPASATPMPRMPDGRPDFTGVWWPGRDITPATSSAVYRDGDRGGVHPSSFGSLYKDTVCSMPTRSRST